MAWNQPSQDRFLGKEVEFYKIVYKILDAITNAVIAGDTQRFISLVEHLERNYPYKNEKYLKLIEELNDEFDSKLRNIQKDRLGKEDHVEKFKVILEYHNKKFEYLVNLFKEKKMYPQEAEESEL